MIQPKPKPHIESLAHYRAGDPFSPNSNLIRLSFNEGAFGPNVKAITAYHSASTYLHRYPDLTYAELRTAIAAAYSIEADRIICGAGSDDLIILLARAYAGEGDEIIYSQYGFAMYSIVAKAVGATGVAVPEKNLTLDVDAMLAAVTPRTRIVYIANPNNPTGSYISESDLMRLHAGLPREVLLVLDAAYAEYMTESDYTDGLGLAATTPNVVVTHTFSKIHALGGMRVGWAYGSMALADTINRLRNPFNIAGPAAAAAIASLEDRDFLRRSREHNKHWRGWLSAELNALGFHVHPSVANFVLTGVGSTARAQALISYMRDGAIQIRPMPGYGLPDHVRITVGKEDEMLALVAALKNFCAKES
ncbi:MAG: histidinol-phosphate transaminase [Alphaproteobacteria bacterium]